MLGLALDYVFLIEKEVACIANQKITTFIIGQCRLSKEIQDYFG